MSSEGRVDFVFTGGGNKVQVGISTFPGITDMRHSQSGRSYEKTVLFCFFKNTSIVLQLAVIRYIFYSMCHPMPQ